MGGTSVSLNGRPTAGPNRISTILAVNSARMPRITRLQQPLRIDPLSRPRPCKLQERSNVWVERRGGGGKEERVIICKRIIRFYLFMASSFNRCNVSMILWISCYIEVELLLRNIVDEKKKRKRILSIILLLPLFENFPSKKYGYRRIWRRKKRIKIITRHDQRNCTAV